MQLISCVLGGLGLLMMVSAAILVGMIALGYVPRREDLS